MPACFSSLPEDLIISVSVYFDIESYFSVRQVCRNSRNALKSESAARASLQNSILYTREARETVTSHDSDRFQNAASRVHAYRQALKTAKPFSVSVLSYGISFCYSGGILCYHTDDQIRQLDVFGLSRKEKVIDVQALLEHHAIKTVTRASFGDLPTKFELLSCSENVLVFLCRTTSSDKSWLFAIERHQWNATPPRTRILARQHLSCTAKLLVRESDTHLYTGTHSGRTSHEHREWLVQGFDLRTGQALTRKPVQLADFAGSEVGATVCFKIYDNHFYAVTNQNSFEVEEVDWTSYYHVVRFAVDDPAPDVRPRRIWRRQHVEGPLNDTWLDLSLQKDEQTGELLIIECRKEWLSNSSDCIRTYYTTPLNWDETEEISPTRILPANDPMTRTLDDKSRPNYAPARKRTRRHYHREYEDQSGGRRDFILARTRHRSYNAATSSFIDLVSDEVPVPGSWRQQERLRLRIGTRQLKPRITQDPVGHESSHLDEESDQNFTPTKHHMWPPDNASSELYDIICPAGRARPVKVAADERSIVYMTEPLPGKDEGAIVLISFDPAWHPPELTRFTATDGPITDETVTNARTTPDSPPTKKRTCGFSGGEMSSAPGRGAGLKRALSSSSDWSGKKTRPTSASRRVIGCVEMSARPLVRLVLILILILTVDKCKRPTGRITNELCGIGIYLFKVIDSKTQSGLAKGKKYMFALKQRVEK